MSTNVIKDLVGYLTTGQMPEAEPVVVEAEISVVVGGEAVLSTVTEEENAMFLLMAWMKRLGMSAKDLHYRAKGRAFYAIHELADFIWRIDNETDHIAEVYYMGDKGIAPPLMAVVYKKAVEMYPETIVPDGALGVYVEDLSMCAWEVTNLIEKIKKSYPDIKAGVTAVLDAISQQCLVAMGFLQKTDEPEMV